MTSKKDSITKGRISSKAAKRSHHENEIDKRESELSSLLFRHEGEFNPDNYDLEELPGEMIKEIDGKRKAMEEIGTSSTLRQLESPWTDKDKSFKNETAASGSRLQKLRDSRNSGIAWSSNELERRLRKRYRSTALQSARTDWSMIQPKLTDSSVDIRSRVLASSGTLLESSSAHLPANLLNIVRAKDANEEDPSSSVVRSVKFHPKSSHDAPLLMTAGLDKTLRFFQIGTEENKKVHGIHFPKFPIYNASFLSDSGNVVVTGRRPFFYIYNAVAGKVDLVPTISGREEKSWESHSVSPDGRLIALLGNDGYIILFDGHQKRAIGDLKINGSVRSVTFSKDGKEILASGSDSEIYRWDVDSRRCIEKFHNDDGTTTSSLAASARHVAVGTESGVVNLYSNSSSREGMSSNLLKSVMNQHTATDHLCFNHDGQLLAMSSRFSGNCLKVMHVPSRTIYSNWPTSKTPLNYVFSMEFSPGSRYFAIGNDKGKCLLYRLPKYS